MKKKNFILLISSISVAAIALITTSISVAVANYRKTITTSKEFVDSIKRQTEDFINEKLDPETNNQLSLIALASKLNINISDLLNQKLDGIFDSLNKELTTKLKTEIDEANQNIFESIELHEIRYQEKYSFVFQINLSNKYLYDNKEIKNIYTAGKNKIRFEIQTEILYDGIGIPSS